MTCPRTVCWCLMNNTPKPDLRPFALAAQARRRALAEWRGVDLAPLEIARADRAQPVRQIVSQVLKDLHLDRRRGDAEVLKAWNDLIDPNITAHAQPINLHQGTLFIAVDNSTWLSEIVRYRRKEILDRLQKCFGKDLVVKLSFRAG
jgi:hypothetical protein